MDPVLYQANTEVSGRIWFRNTGKFLFTYLLLRSIPGTGTYLYTIPLSQIAYTSAMKIMKYFLEQHPSINSWQKCDLSRSLTTSRKYGTAWSSTWNFLIHPNWSERDYIIERNPRSSPLSQIWLILTLPSAQGQAYTWLLHRKTG
jgi:hypothetical protein